MTDRLSRYHQKIECELRGNLLPYWLRYSADRIAGGFYGEISSKNVPVPNAPKMLVQHARLLWNFSHAYRVYGDACHREMADYAFAFVMEHFWDAERGGAPWSLDAQLRVLHPNKKVYGQAFLLYGLSEYALATGNRAALERGITLFGLLQEYALDRNYGGYLEACGPDWKPVHDPVTGNSGTQEKKSMNTTIHVLEAFSNLLRVYDAPALRKAQLELAGIVADKVIDGARAQQNLFFDEQWNSLKDVVSYGHDIETSWLLVEAADLLGDPVFTVRASQLALRMAEVTLNVATLKDGSIAYEGTRLKVLDRHKVWWVQAESLVGFLNAYQLSGQTRYLEAFFDTWDFIEDYLVDRRYGEWHLRLTPDRRPLPKQPKGNGWKTPYHNTRACFEALRRIPIIRGQA